MTLSLSALNIRGVLLDIEGTTTPLSFVYDVLFPFAKANVKDYLATRADSGELGLDLARLREEHAGDVARKLSPPKLFAEPREAANDSMAAYVQWLIDHDRKSTGLKSLQGKIWQQGYFDGTLTSWVFPDVPHAFERWQRAGFQVCIFSSGSVLAQKLLFTHTEVGDLSSFIGDYFDTTIGPKTEAESYFRIAARMQLAPEQIVFVSDVTTELDAAAAAQVYAILCVRPGNRMLVAAERYPEILSFDDLAD